MKEHQIKQDKGSSKVSADTFVNRQTLNCKYTENHASAMEQDSCVSKASINHLDNDTDFAETFVKDILKKTEEGNDKAILNVSDELSFLGRCTSRPGENNLINSQQNKINLNRIKVPELKRQESEPCQTPVLTENVDDDSEGLFVCPFCPKTFKYSNNLTRHKHQHDGKTYLCEICSKVFNDPRNLKKHQKCVHENEAKFICKRCQRAFKQRTHLEAHELRHTGVQEFKCGICERQFNRKKSLLNHLSVHTQEKAFKCELCPMAFNHKAGLQFHMGKHTGAPGLPCEFCDKMFDRKANLRRHMLTHTGERPFKCEFCEHGFIQKVSLDEHVKKFHNDDNTNQSSLSKRNPSPDAYKFSCDVCSKRFTQRYNLNRHVRTSHEMVDNVTCDICEQSYSSLHFLNKHKQLVHSNEVSEDYPDVTVDGNTTVDKDQNLYKTSTTDEDGHTNNATLISSDKDSIELMNIDFVNPSETIERILEQETENS